MMKPLLALCCLAGLLGGARCAAAADRVYTGTIHYPLRDNLDFEEGTFECWFMLLVDPDLFERTKPSANVIVELARFGGASGGLGMQLLTGGVMGDDVGWYIRPGPKPLMRPVTAKVAWRPGEWHHLAVTWLGPVTTLLLDGQQVARYTQQASFKVAFGAMDEQLLIGEKWHVCGRFAIDELRLSAIARLPDELGFFNLPLQPDPYTCLLDDFDQTFEPDNQQRTSPCVSLAAGGGKVSSQCRFIDGKSGKALALMPRAAE